METRLATRPQARSRGQWRAIGPNTKDCQFRSYDSCECLTFRKTDKNGPSAPVSRMAVLRDKVTMAVTGPIGASCPKLPETTRMMPRHGIANTRAWRSISDARYCNVDETVSGPHEDRPRNRMSSSRSCTNTPKIISWVRLWDRKGFCSVSDSVPPVRFASCSCCCSGW